MKIVARMLGNQQYTEDNWEAIAHIKEIAPETTIKELIEWQKQKFTSDSNIQKGTHIKQIYISQMDE